MTYEIGKLTLETLLGPVAAAEDALARLDERVARSEVGSGFAARADFFESVSSMWVAGELVHLEDLVLHDAQMDIRAPSHELVIAHRIVRARRRVSRNDPGWAVSRSGIMALAGVERLPVESHVLQAFVTESLKPVIDTGVTFGAGHLYLSQSDKGSLVFGGDIDGYNSYAQRGNLPVVEEVMSEMVALFPGLARVRLLRSWGGIMDMTMDGSPIITTGPLPGMYLNCGWCYGGFKATPASGYSFAWTIARDEPHAINAPFTLERFHRGAVIDDKGQGATPRLH